MNPEPVVGERFYPTDEELVDYYLKRKLVGILDHESPIAEVNVYKVEPWELPQCSKTKSKDKFWFFISPREFMDKKKQRFCRKTKAGFWKPTGASRKVKAKRTKKEIASKKTLVFYDTHPQARTEWVMHEYEFLPHPDLPNSGEFVIIKLKRKHNEKTKKSKPNCETDKKTKKSKSDNEIASTYENKNQTENETTVNSACCSEVVSHDFDNENTKEMTAVPKYERCEPSCQMASSSDVQSSITEFQEGESNPPNMMPPFGLENCTSEIYGLLESDFDYQIMAIDIEDGKRSPPTMMALPSENKVTIDKVDPSQSTVRNNQNLSVAEKLPTAEDVDWWNNVDIPDIDPQLLEKLEIFSELKRLP